MRRNIIVAKKALSPETCNKIIELGKLNFVDARIGEVGNNELNKRIRDSQICWLDEPLKYLDIIHPIQKLIADINYKFYGFDISGHENFQVTKYDEKNRGKYDPHFDGVYDNVAPGGTVRKLSVSIQLTSADYYEGGNLIFPDDKHSFNAEDAKEQGTAIFFPSYVLHGVEPVTKGIRFSLVCWSTGPNFY
tara:strand:- start:37 stop:609 length:573 start_codon:yes stop_codon:yes gene_type:complete